MTQKLPLSASTALIFGAALLSTPALAQTAQTVTPPPVVPTVSQPAPAAPPAATQAPVVRIAPSAPVVQAIPEPTPEATAAAEAAPAPATRRAPARAERTAPARAQTRAVTPTASDPAPVTEAPVPTEMTPTVAAAPEPVAPIEPPVEVVPPAETAPTGGAIWPWLLGGVALVIAALAFVLMRRRRTEYDEPADEYIYEDATAEAPVVTPVAAPIAAERPRHEPEVASRVLPVDEVEIAHPLVSAESATVAAADADDVAGMAAGTAPVSQRPWLELGIRPVRAGVSAEEALVEIELIVGNAGDMAAQDVRISTFMIPGGQSASEMEQMLIERAGESAVPAVTIEPGEGKTVDATLAAPKAELTAQGDSFSPVVVADARYRLPDGSEGRTSASFRIGVTDGDGAAEPIALRGMYDNVVAELEGAPARV